MANERQDDRMAILIDADNISHHYITELMQEVARYGTPTVKRIYGDWTRPNLGGWKSVLLDHAITPVQQFGYTYGKNATDSALIIDAMDILYGERVDIFCLVSSDSDFTRLATRLREAGKLVFGIGEQKTPNAFIAACDKFIYIEILARDQAEEERASADAASSSSGRGSRGGRGRGSSQAANQPAAPQATPAQTGNGGGRGSAAHGQGGEREPEPERSSGRGGQQTRTIRKIDRETRTIIHNAVSDLADEHGWSFLGDVGNVVLRMRPSFDSRNYGYQKLSAMMRAMPTIELDERTTGQPNVKHIYIRIKE